MTDLSETIPEDLLAAAHDLNMSVRVMSTLEQQAEVLATALLAERRAQIEACAKIARSFNDKHYRLPTHPDALRIEAAIRAQLK